MSLAVSGIVLLMPAAIVLMSLFQPDVSAGHGHMSGTADGSGAVE